MFTKQLIREQFTKIRLIENASEFILKPGTVLYHGTGEEFNVAETSTGGYDGMFWTCDNEFISRSYIPDAGSAVMTSTSMLAHPPRRVNGGGVDTQDAFGFTYSAEYDDSGNLKSHSIPDIFKKQSDAEWELDQKTMKLYNQLKLYDAKYKESEKNDIDLGDDFFDNWIALDDEYKALVSNASNVSVKKAAMDHVNDILTNKYGYKPRTVDPYGDHSWFLKLDGDKILPANYMMKGRLLTVTPKENLRIFDMTLGGSVEGDLTDLDYHSIDVFRNAQKNGYDGVKINDFAQMLTSSGRRDNVGHVSIGFFRNTIPKLNIKAVESTHPNPDEFYNKMFA